MRTLVQGYGFIQTILKAEVNVGMRNIEMASDFSSLSLGFITSYCLHV